MNTPDAPPEPVKAVTLRIPETLDQKVDGTAAEVGLSRADVMRLSLERGMEVLVRQLKSSQPAA